MIHLDMIGFLIVITGVLLCISMYKRRNRENKDMPVLPVKKNRNEYAKIPEETGPRGIHPHQYPVCPIDRQRNEEGKDQKIFWNPREDCYRCTHGHRFKSNGQLLG